MGKIKKLLENELVGGTQTTDVYPITSTKAVYDENNERLDNIIDRIKGSHIGYITAFDNYNNIVIANGRITFKPICDIYYNDKFYRVGSDVESQTIEIPSSGSAVIYLNQDTKKFGITTNQGILGNCIELGRTFNGELVVIYGKYTYNGLRYNYGNPVIVDDVNYDNDTSPISQKQAILLSNYTTVIRGEVSISSDTVTLSAGTYYFYPRIGSKEYVIVLDGPSVFTLNNDYALVAELQYRRFTVKNKSEVSINDVICLFKDGLKGICDGVWFNKGEWFNKIDISSIAMIVRGKVMKSGNTITITNGDFYVPTLTNKFYRITTPLTITVTGGTAGIWYNYNSNTVKTANFAASSDELMLGVTDGSNVFLNGQYTVTDSDTGETYYNYISDKIIKHTDNTNVPSFVFNNGKEAYQRLMDWCGNDSNVFLLAQVTDVHSGGSTRYEVVGWLNELNKLFNFNVMGNFGDIGLDTSSTTGDKEATYSLVVNTKKQMSSNSPWIFMKGNHERIEANGIISENIYGEIFNKATRRNYPQLVLSSNGSYGYIDDVNTKTRTIILNTSDVSTGVGYKISVEQLQWLIEAINNTSNGYKIVVVSHLCVDDIGRWASYPADASGSGFDTLRSILNSIANHTNGSNSSTGLSWDFTNKTSVKLVCSLAGDSHFNNYIKRDGVNYIVRQGYGGISESEMPEGSSRDNFSWDSICNFDVLAVKQNGNAKVFRIGIGGESRDLAFTF